MTMSTDALSDAGNSNNPAVAGDNCGGKNDKLGFGHRWVLPVLRYHRNTVVYHYPLVGVIFMVILHVFII